MNTQTQSTQPDAQTLTEVSRIYRGLRFTNSRYMDGSPEIGWKGNFRTSAEAARRDAKAGGAVSCVRLMSDGSTEVVILGWGQPWETTSESCHFAAIASFRRRGDA